MGQLTVDSIKHRDEWSGDYRGIRIEVCRFTLGDKLVWNYYLYIPAEQLPDDKRTAFNLRGKRLLFTPTSHPRLMHDYTSAPIISDLDWHGGITFYEKHRDEWGKVDGFKLGCDYAHYWDEGRDYGMGYVLMEARQSVDKLYEHIPDLKQRCTWDGWYYPASEGALNNNGHFIANVNKDK